MEFDGHSNGQSAGPVALRDTLQPAGHVLHLLTNLVIRSGAGTVHQRQACLQLGHLCRKPVDLRLRIAQPVRHHQTGHDRKAGITDLAKGFAKLVDRGVERLRKGRQTGLVAIFTGEPKRASGDGDDYLTHDCPKTGVLLTTRPLTGRALRPLRSSPAGIACQNGTDILHDIQKALRDRLIGCLHGASFGARMIEQLGQMGPVCRKPRNLGIEPLALLQQRAPMAGIGFNRPDRTIQPVKRRLKVIACHG